MTIHTLQVSGSRGEVTPLMHARVDTEFYQAALARARNIVVSRYGPLTRVPGTLYQGDTKNHAAKSRLIGFQFSETQVYAIEVGDEYMRFWTATGQVFDGGSPYEIVSPYAAADLQNINPVQSGDTLYLFCKGYRPQLLKRVAETNWTIEGYVTKDGPYMDVNTTDTTMTPASTGSATPKMTSNTAPAPAVVTSSAGAADAFNVFDQSKKTQCTISTGSIGFIQIDLGAGNAKVVDAYAVTAPHNNSKWDDMPSQFALLGSNDGTSWTTLDSRDGETGFAGSETRYFTMENRAAFRYYQLDCSGGGGDDDANTAIGELWLHQAADDQTPFDLTASSTTGINDDQGFQASDVGRPVRLYGADGRWRWAEIKSVTSTTVVKIVLHGHALPDTSPIVAWALGAWSDETGWPHSGKFYEDRLFAAGSDTDPLGVWASVSASYDDFRRSTPLVDDDAVTVRLTGGSINAIHWLAEAGSLLAGTAGSLRSIGSRDNTNVITPTNIKQRQETAVPSSAVQPVEVETVALFVDRLKKRLYEAAYSYEADGYLAREVSTLNEHLFLPGVEEIDFVDDPNKFVVARRSDGKVIAFTYDREQKVVGGTLIDWGGSVESVLAIPGEQATDTWLIVNRTVNGQTRRYVERMAPFYRAEDPNQTSPVYASCAFEYSGAATGALTGLDPMEGETLGIWADGQDIGDAVVTGGTLTLPNDVEASDIVAGLRMPWELETLRLPQIGNRDGSGLGRKAKIVSALIDVFESAGVQAGSLTEQSLLRYEDEVETDPDDPVPLRTGMVPIPVDDGWQNNGVFVINGDTMYPATIRAISLEVEGEP